MKQRSISLALMLSVMATPSAYARNDSTSGAAKAPYDVQFLDTMAEHHRDGIKMMELAVDKAHHQEVKDKARMMLGEQQKDIPELEAMRERIDADAPEAVNMKLPGMMPMDDKLKKLTSLSGSAFDHAFLDTTIEHHQSAVKMAKAELESGKSAEVKDKAKESIDKQIQEIAELKQMRDSVTQ